MVLVRGLLWWAGLAGLFMLFAAEWTGVDWEGAGGAGLVAAGLALLMWRAGLLGHRFRWRWLSAVPAVAKQIVADFGIITAVLIRQLVRGRRDAGQFVARDDFPIGAGRDGTGWRAWVEMAATWSPNSYVVDIDVEAGTRLSHDLTPHRPSEQPA